MNLFLSVIKSFTKIRNIGQVFLSFLLSVIFRKPLIKGLPISLSIEPVNFCNLHCPECPAGNGTLTRNSGKFALELYSKTIQNIAPYTSYLTLYFQGEPLLHPQFIDFVQIARKYNLYTASSTNAQLLNDEMAKKIVESGLSKFIISMDGASQAVYEKYRVGGSLEKVKEAIRVLVKWKDRLQSKTPIIELQFLVLKHNEHQIDEIRGLAKKLRVDKLSFKSAQIYDFENGSELLPSLEKYARYKQASNGLFVRKKKIKNRCWRVCSGAVITANGDVLPCSFDKNGEYVFGNVNENTLAEIWHNDKAQQFRAEVFENRSMHEICRNCTM